MPILSDFISWDPEIGEITESLNQNKIMANLYCLTLVYSNQKNLKSDLPFFLKDLTVLFFLKKLPNSGGVPKVSTYGLKSAVWDSHALKKIFLLGSSENVVSFNP